MCFTNTEYGRRFEPMPGLGLLKKYLIILITWLVVLPFTKRTKSADYSDKIYSRLSLKEHQLAIIATCGELELKRKFATILVALLLIEHMPYLSHVN